MRPVAHDHGGQNPRRVMGHSPAQGPTQPSLEPGRPGAEGAALPQPFQRFVPEKFPGQRDAVRVEVEPVRFRRRFQRELPTHPLPGLAFGQGGAPDAEVCRLAVHLFHPQHRVHDARIIGAVRPLHLGGQGGGFAVVSRLQRLQLRIRVHRQRKAQQTAQ